MRNKNILLLLLVLSSIHEVTAQRRVLLEHYTSSWCGECPNAHLIASQIAADHPDRVILAYHHSSVDPMANPHSTAWKDEFLIFGTPLGVINRTPPAPAGPIYASTGQWGSLVEAQLEEPDYLDLNIHFEPQAATGNLSFEVSIELLQELPGPGALRLSVMVVEDSIRSAAPGYQQSNYYNEVAGHPLFGQGGSIQMYPFMNVVRDIVDETWGSSAGLPDQPETGEIYSWEGHFDLSDNWDPKHLRLIAVATLHDGEDIRSRPVLDARAIDIGDLLLTSTSREAEPLLRFQAFPNPAQHYVELHFPKDEYELRLFDTQGKLIHATRVSGESHTINTMTVPKGIYSLVLISTAGQFGAQRLVVK
jgi:hypothetical protein